MSKRQALVDAAAELLWEGGYEAMSPRKVLARSGAGQGSMYHHFSGKEALAREALEEHARIVRMAGAEALSQRGLKAVFQWLDLPRAALRGCRLGRLANEAAVRQSAVMRTPLDDYFREIEAQILQRLQQAKEDGEITGSDLAAVAASLVAMVQGGYVMSLATADPDALERALRGGRVLLQALRRPKRGR